MYARADEIILFSIDIIRLLNRSTHPLRNPFLCYLPPPCLNHSYHTKDRVKSVASGTLEQEATVTSDEMVEHSFYQMLNLVQVRLHTSSVVM